MPRNLFPLLYLVVLLTASHARAADPLDDYLSLDLQELLSLEVTSVARKKQRVNDSAAAIFVITRDDIRRSGVTSIPEALRLAPGIQVARIDANKWAISSRGFASQFANKLLVLIDGRSVYTPTYAGVYWEVQDVLLEDIDRIEVIRGPGSTIWGANAVNGVINIITRPAAESVGTLVGVGAGNEEQLVTLRHGFALDEGSAGRVYAKFNRRESSYSPDLNGEAGDDWDKTQMGFRIDLALSEQDSLTLQGDAYHANENQVLREFILDPADPANLPPDPQHPFLLPFLPDAFESEGYNLLMRWVRDEGDRQSSFQVYVDHSDRQEQVLRQRVDTFDIDFSQNLKLGRRNELVWGLGYRRIEDDFDDTFRTVFYQDPKIQELYNLFVQDEFAWREDLKLTAGIKWEHNDYTGSETQPSLRLLWAPDARHAWWLAASRAVRTPSRLETNSSIVTYQLPPDPADPVYYPFPGVLRVEGNPDVKSEILDALELGYRWHLDERISLDLALFHNRYSDLVTFEATGSLSFQVPNPLNPGEWFYPPNSLTYDNLRDATSQGAELSLDWQAHENWRLRANYSWLDLSADVDDSSTDAFGDTVLKGSSARYQWSLRSQHSITPELSMDLWIQHVDALSRSGFSRPRSIPAHTRFNLRMAWQKDDLELSLVAFNLLKDRHSEFGAENIFVYTDVERSVLATLRWDF